MVGRNILKKVKSYRCCVSEQVLTSHVRTGKSSTHSNQEVEYSHHHGFD